MLWPTAGLGVDEPVSFYTCTTCTGAKVRRKCISHLISGDKSLSNLPPCVLHRIRMVQNVVSEALTYRKVLGYKFPQY